MLLTLAIIGFVAILLVSGAIWAINNGAEIIGAILLCIVVGAVVVVLFMI
mgnify:CR=1 FL=1